MDRPDPLKSFEVMRTRDAEAARQSVLHTFGASRFDLPEGAAGFEASANFASLGDVAFCHCNYASAVHIAFPEADIVRQQICLSGSGSSVAGSLRGDVDARNWSALIPDEGPVDFRYAAGFRQMMIWFDRGRLDRTYSALVGARRSGTRLALRSDVNAPAMQALRRAVEVAVSELDAGGGDVRSPALTEMQDLLMTRFLYTYHVDLLEPGASRALAPSQLHMRNLEDYLRVHWNEPLTVAKLAEVAHVGARSVFRYFRETHGSTPLDFMKTLRLLEAQRGLQNPTDATSVLSEALRCGFNNMGHFAKDYRRKFGELPSQTLRKARRP